MRELWDRLPKTANASLEQMDQQIQSLEARVAELQGTEVTDTKARPGSSLAWYPLPSGQEYEFDMSDEDKLRHMPKSQSAATRDFFESAIDYEVSKSKD